MQCALDLLQTIFMNLHELLYLLDKRLMLTGCSDFRCRFKMKNGELYDLRSNNLNECARQSFSTIYSRFDFCRKSLQNYN